MRGELRALQGNALEDLSSSSSLRVLRFPLFFALSSATFSTLGLSSNSLAPTLFLRRPLPVWGESPESRRAFENRSFKLSRATLAAVVFHLGVSKSESSSDGG